MNRKLGVGILVLTIVALVGGQSIFSEQSKKATLSLSLPQAETKVFVDKEEIKGTGTKRDVEVSADKGEITLSITWEPNGYTQFIRTQKVAVKADGTVKLDLSDPDPKKTDDIQVIYVPTPDDVVEEMSKLAKVNKDDVVYDLGCGDGRIVIAAVKKFNAKKGVGIDLKDDRVKESLENVKKAGVEDKVEIRKGNVLEIKDLSSASVVMLYMGDYINLRLRPILKSTLKPGSRVVSHRFTMGDWKPNQTVAYRGKNGYDYNLHLWIIEDPKLEKK